MPVSAFTNLEEELAYFDRRAAALAFETSRELSSWRADARRDPSQVVLNLISSSGLVRAAAVRTKRKGHDQIDNAFGIVDDPSEYIVGTYEDDHVSLYLGLAANHESTSEPLRWLAELLAHQIGQFMAARHLRQRNQATERQLHLDRAELQLRKTMERARALLSRYNGLTPLQATDHLVSTSVRTGRPLLEVADRLILAYASGIANFCGPDGSEEVSRPPRFRVA